MNIDMVEVPEWDPGMWKLAKFGLLLSSKETFGTTLLMTYAPTPEGSDVTCALADVVAGIGAVAMNARTLENAPTGLVSWIVILPVALLVVMPVSVFALPLRNAA